MQSAGSAVALRTSRKQWMDYGEADGMVMPSDALSVRMTRWDVGGRQLHSIVFLSPSYCAATIGCKDSSFWSRVATLLRTLVSPEWY